MANKVPMEFSPFVGPDSLRAVTHLMKVLFENHTPRNYGYEDECRVLKTVIDIKKTARNQKHYPLVLLLRNSKIDDSRYNCKSCKRERCQRHSVRAPSTLYCINVILKLEFIQVDMYCGYEYWQKARYQ